MAKTDKTKVFIVSHTHWDREWYLPFQEYRHRMLKVVDKAIEVMTSNPRFRSFMLDCQASLVEDYLELRPERAGEVAQLVSSGRLVVGPLYTQPDEALVSPESLVRNFLIGMSVTKKLGRVPKLGYLPDTFGHVAQLPQVLRGFGIDNFFFMRGLGDEVGTELVWEAPDGSRVIAIYFAKGYGNAGRLGVEDRTPIEIWEGPGGWKTVFLRSYYETPSPRLEKARERVEELVRDLKPRSASGVVLLMNGGDHQPIQESIVEVIEYLNSVSKDLVLVHGTLEEYLDHVRPMVNELKVVRGELRGARSHYILSDVLSTRVYLKQLNYKAQLALERYAEPLSVIAMLEGLKYPYGELLLAWKTLLKNQSHDSIYGSGSDPTHVDNESRYLQVIEIASSIAYDSLRYLASKLGASGGGLGVLVFNPLAWPRTGVVRVLVPESYVKDGGSLVVDVDGGSVETQVVEEGVFWEPYKTLVFIARDLPPLGLKTFKLKRAPASDLSRVVEDGGLVIENEYLRVEADPGRGGALRVLDKSNGLVYDGLNVFVDEGDAGDEYNYSPPEEGDAKVVSSSFKASVRRVVGPVFSKLVISLELEVPEKLGVRGRASKKVRLPVTTEVVLYNGVKRVDVRVSLRNTALDHRLRARFPTRVRSDRVWANSHFYVCERRVRRLEEMEGWVEKPVNDPMLGWVSVSDENRGLTIAARGLYEYEARVENGQLTIYMTLFRSVGWLSKNNLKTRRGHAGPPIETPGAQCLRDMVFEYSIIPHKGDWLSSKSYKEAEEYLTPPLSVLHDNLNPTSKSYVSISNDKLLVTALKKTEEGDRIVLRAYNITNEEQEATVRLGFRVGEAWEARLDEEVVKKLNVNGSAVQVTLQPNKISTIVIARHEG